MSTNSHPPFGDVVVVTSDGILQDCFEWDEIQRKLIYELREYHLALILILDDLAHNDPCGSDTPRRPKGASLLGNKKPSNKLCGVELHKYLIKSLLCTDVVNQTGFCERWDFYTHLGQISPHLVVAAINGLASKYGGIKSVFGIRMLV